MKNMETGIMNHSYKLNGMFPSSLARRVGWLGLVVMLGCALFYLPLIRESAGQRKVPPREPQKQPKQQVEVKQTTDLPKIVSVRGEGGKALALRTREKQVAVPPPLSEEVKTSLLRSAGVKETKAHDSFKLTPAKPYQTQGLLAFEEIEYLDPESNYLTVLNQDSFFDDKRANKRVVFSMNIAAGKKYLIDFTVTGDKFFVSDLPGNMEETFRGTNHVLIVYEATSTGEVEFNLTGTGRSGHVWTFHSCELTRLN